MINYYDKYFKYKLKYLNLKINIFGGTRPRPQRHKVEIVKINPHNTKPTTTIVLLSGLPLQPPSPPEQPSQLQSSSRPSSQSQSIVTNNCI